jgi:hypothetical protein
MPQTPFRIVSASSCRAGRLSCCAAVAVAWCLVAASGLAADYGSLSQVEVATETRDYSQQIRDKKFAAEQQAYLTGILLPQLSKDANRTGIARTRQRIRELALRDAAKEVVDPINGLLRDAMIREAAAAEADSLIRVNAMLLVAELVGADGKPWPAAAKPLADAAVDAALPLEVRVAALSGLARHITTAAAGSPEIAAIAGPTVSALLATPPEGDPVAVRWMVARALQLLPAAAPSPAAIAAAATILADDAADTDLRVRAAAALGKLARPDAGIDAPAAVGHICTAAIAALEADLAAAEQRRLAKKLAGGTGLQAGMNWQGDPGFMPRPRSPDFGGGMLGGPLGGEFGAGGELGVEADEDAVPPLACRRDAWRLYVLAEAIRPGRSGPGLADLLAGDPAASAGDLAAALRRAALELDAQPDEQTLKLALASIKEAALPAKGQPDGTPAPAAGIAQPPSSPFEKPAEPSPF